MTWSQRERRDTHCGPPAPAPAHALPEVGGRARRGMHKHSDTSRARDIQCSGAGLFRKREHPVGCRRVFKVTRQTLLSEECAGFNDKALDFKDAPHYGEVPKEGAAVFTPFL